MMTALEKSLLFDKVRDLEEQGKFDEAEALQRQIPLSPHIARAVKEVYGANYIVQHGYNLSEAEEVYGKDWVSK